MSVSAPISKNSTFFSSSSPAKSSNRPASHFWSPCRFGSSSNATLICYLHRPFEPFSTALIQNIQQLDKDSRNKSISSIVESKVRQSNILKPAACFHHSVTCYSLIYLLLCLQIIPSLSASLLLGRGNSNKTNNDPLELYKNNFNDSVTQPAETSNSILIIKNDSVSTVKYSSNKNNFTNFVLFSAKSNKWPMPNSSIYKNVDTKCSVPKECSDNVSSVYSKPLSDTIQQFINISKATNNNTDTVNEHTVSNGDKNVSESASERELPLLGKSFLSTSDSNDSSLFFSLQRAHMNVSQKTDNPFVKAKHKKPKKIISYQNDHLLRNSNDSILVNREKIKNNSRELYAKKNYSKYSENFDYRRFRYFGKRDDNSNSVDVGKNNSTSTESADKSKKLTSAADGIVTKIYPGPTSTSSHVVNQKVPAVTTTPQGAKARASKRKPQQERGPGGMRRVSLLGLFELSTRWGERPEGRSELAAALLAVKHVNERRLLPGYYLHLLTNDTKCDPGVGVDRFFHALYTQTSTRMVMLLGSACSEVTESLAKVVPYWNIVQVSFGSTSPALSDRNEFPLFYRTVAPDSSHNPARIAFIRRFGWDTVTALSQNEEVYSLAVNDLVTELEQANITCAATITFAETDFKEQLKLLRELDTRIIIGSFSHEMAPKIFCEAYELGMFGADYAWILQGPPLPAWWKNSTECAQGNLASAVDRLILVSSHNSIVGEEMVSYSGLTNDMFMAEMKSMKVPLSRYAPQTYDAVWAIALALRGAETAWARSQNLTLESFFSRKLMSIGKPTHPPGHMTPEKEARQQTRNTTGNKYTTSIKNFKNQIPSTSFFSLGHFDYTRKDMAEEFLQQIGHLNFLGVSGPVSFSGADRVGTSAFYQVQDGVAHPVALFEPAQGQLDFECPACRGVDWRGGQVPVAKRVFKRRIETIAPAAFLAVTSLALVGVVLAIAFLAFNLHFRRIKSIKLSSPRLNNMTIVGCILVYGAVALLGLDHATLPASVHFSVICTARVYLLTAGFSLAFGSMFAKTYRVHRIFIGNRSGVCKNKLLQDTQLISLICALLLIDGLIVTLWVVIDPMQRHLRNLTLEISSVDRGVVYQPQVEVCQSQNTNGWLGALYVYKGLLLVVGVYMAWETRHVKISALNDSQYIGISVYSVVITSGIVVVLANIISERATLAYVSITTLILISTTATLCLLFLPKLLAILKKEDNTDPIIQSMGLKLECNTRRFMTDDKRELQYRVEIQNKVYRREMAALDKEINRLERLLTDSNPNSNSSSSTSLVQHKKMELTVAQEGQGRKPSRDEYARTPSIGGGLPLLLLSVLPPVIPRASWPSSENAHLPMRRSVTFSSEPKLDDGETQPAIDLYNLRLLNRRPDENTGLLARIRNLFGSRPASRKTSSASIAGNSGAGIAAALKLHMGMIAGLVPGAQRHNMVLSCNTLDVHASRRNLRRESFARSGPTINILSDDTYDDREGESNKNFNETLLFSNLIKRESQKNMLETEAKVNFRLPPDRRRPSVTHQISQPVLSFKDRAKGSPRFPHKIVPTCSLSTLDDQRKASMGNTLNVALIDSNFRRSSHQPQTDRPTVPRPSLDRLMGGRWKSMEDATLTLPGSRRGSGLLAVSYIPSDVYHHRRPDLSMITPDRDVWATADFGIPLSRLDVEVEGQRAKYIRKDNSESSLS